MLQTRVIPCLLKRNSSLVKTIQFKNPKYIGDAINTIQIFNNFEVDEIILLDISRTTEKKPIDFNFIKKVTNECFMPFTYGGGIKSIEDIKKIFSLGVEKVVLCTKAAEEPDIIKEASSIFGKQSIVVSVDVKKSFFGKYSVFTESGRKNLKVDPVTYAQKMESYGAGEIFLNSIDNDGVMEGFDVELIRRVASSLTVPLIACGGAGLPSHIVHAIESGASAVAAGSLFVYQNKNRAVLINYPSRDEIETLLKR